MKNFTIEDLSGSGQYLVRMDAQQQHRLEKEKKSYVVDTGYLSTIMYKVGYVTNNWNIGGSREQVMCLISMSDGWTRIGNLKADEKTRQTGIHDIDTTYEKTLWISDELSTAKQKLVDYLNDPDESEFRFATQEEVVRVVMYQSSRWK